MTLSELGPAGWLSRTLVAVQPRLVAELIGHRLHREAGVSVVDVVWTGEDILPAVETSRPEVLVLDLHLLAGDVGAFLGRIRDVRPDARTVILTGGSAERLVMEAVEAGCTSFVATSSSEEDLVAAVHAARTGEPHLPAELVAELMHRLDRSHRPIRDELTARELDVLRLLAAGLNNAAVADRLGLSVNTVRHHVQGILNRLGVHTKLQAVTLALRQGLISPEDD